MKPHFILAASLKRGFGRDGVEDYLKRLRRYGPVDFATVPDISSVDDRPAQARKILARIKERDYLVALDERGKALDTPALARKLKTWRQTVDGRLIFLVGGAWGLDESVREAASFVWSLSPLTLPHQLALLLACEQVYRAHTILHNEPYHHGG